MERGVPHLESRVCEISIDDLSEPINSFLTTLETPRRSLSTFHDPESFFTSDERTCLVRNLRERNDLFPCWRRQVGCTFAAGSRNWDVVYEGFDESKGQSWGREGFSFCGGGCGRYGSGESFEEGKGPARVPNHEVKFPVEFRAGRAESKKLDAVNREVVGIDRRRKL